MSCAAAIAALPPLEAPPARRSGSGWAEGGPLCLTATMDACFGQEVQLFQHVLFRRFEGLSMPRSATIAVASAMIAMSRMAA